MKLTLQEIRKIGKALGNDKRVKLLNLCVDKKYNLTELKKKIGLTVQSISRFVREMEEAGLVSTEEAITEKGKNILVRSNYRVTSSGVLEKI